MGKQFTVSGIVKFFGGSASAAEIKKIDKAIADLRGSVAQTREGFASIGQAIKPVGVAGTAVAAGFGVAIKQAMDFESAMAQLNSVNELTEKQFKQIQLAALQFGTSSVFSATEVVQGMTELTKAGLNVEQTMQAIPGVLAAAATEGLELAKSSEIIVNILQGQKLAMSEASRVADVLARTANATSAGMLDLGEAFKYSNALAQQGIMKFEDTAAALGILSNAGLKGSIAGTSLVAMFNQITKPSKDVAAVFGGMDKMMATFTDKATGKLKPLPEIIRLVGKAADRQGNDFQRLMFLTDFVGIEGAKAFGAIQTAVNQVGADGKSSFDSLRDSLLTANGAAQEMADKRLNSVSGVLTRIRQAISTTSVTIGQMFIPGLRDMADSAVSVFRDIAQVMIAFSKSKDELTEMDVSLMSSPIGQFITGFRQGLGEAIEDARSFIGGFRDTLATLFPGLAGNTTQLGVLVAKGLALAAVLGPLMLGMLGVAFAANQMITFFGGVITVGKGVFSMFNSLKAAATMLWPILKGPLLGALGLIKGAVISLGSALMGLVANPVGATIVAIVALVAAGYLLYKNWDAVKGFLVGVWATIKSAAASAAYWIAEKWNGASNLVKFGILALGTVMTGGLLPIIILVARNWDTVTAAMGAAWDWTVNKVVTGVQMFLGWWGGLSEGVKTGVMVIAGVMTMGLVPAIYYAYNHWDKITGFMKSAWESLTSFISRIDWMALLATPIRAASLPLLKLIDLITDLPGAGSALSAFGISVDGLKQEIADLTTFRPVLRPEAPKATPQAIVQGPVATPAAALDASNVGAKVIPFPLQAATPPAAPQSRLKPGPVVMTSPKTEGKFRGVRPEDLKAPEMPKLAPADQMPTIDTSALDSAGVTQAALSAPGGGSRKQPPVEVHVRQAPVDVNLKTSVQIDGREIANAVARHQVQNSERNGDVMDPQSKQKFMSNGGFAKAVGQ